MRPLAYLSIQCLNKISPCTCEAPSQASARNNGFLADPLEVHNGIRQGCPLASMLFVLALDLLFRRVEADSGCLGIWIPHESHGFAVPISGYADDTALYLNGPQEEEAFLSILVDFEAASGLVLNRDKCVAMSLHPAGPMPCHEAMIIKLVATDRATRYLGIPVASVPNGKAMWESTARPSRSSQYWRYTKQPTCFNVASWQRQS